MKMGTKILGGFGLAIAVAATVGTAGYLGTSRIGERLHEVGDIQFPAAQALAVIDEAQTALARSCATLMIERADARMRQGSQPGDASFREF